MLDLVNKPEKSLTVILETIFSRTPTWSADVASAELAILLKIEASNPVVGSNNLKLITPINAEIIAVIANTNQ